MAASTLPPLLELTGEDVWRCKNEFNRLYRAEGTVITDILGNRVVFEESSWWHVCYKRDEEDQSDRRPRNIWSKVRAEHIPRIMAALTDARTEVRPNNHNSEKRLNYLLAVEAEYYIVVVERINKNTVLFTTAYPITAQEWRGYRRVGPALYPPQKKKGG